LPFLPPFVAEVDLRVDLRELKVWVALEALVRIHLYKLSKGKGALNVLVDTGGVDRFVGWGFVGTVVCHLSADFLEKINMYG
jgi:hypothetical protein